MQAVEAVQVQAGVLDDFVLQAMYDSRRLIEAFGSSKGLSDGEVLQECLQPAEFSGPAVYLGAWAWARARCLQTAGSARPAVYLGAACGQRVGPVWPPRGVPGM